MNSETDIAIIGMAGRFPGARDLEEFWSNLAGGVESIRRLSDEEILAAGVPPEWLRRPNYVKAAPVLEEPGHFDAAFFDYSPLEARTMDPQHRLLLELAWEAFEHAGCDPGQWPGRIGVFAGAAMNTHFINAGLGGRFAEDYLPTLIGNDKDFLSTRISYKLNLKGPSVTVQTACSTSMVAVHLARQSLLSGESDAALAGAVSVRFPHRAGYFCDGGGVVSPDGHVRAFDAKANGTVFGSGGGVLVLKRLEDALSDGDTIHAVIKGSAVNNDGSDKAGYTAPSVNCQADVVVEALANAGVDADDITCLEAHGSGTPVGDSIELRALTRAFRTFTRRSGYCALGSVKTNVGHLDAAAAVTGIIKTVLALQHRQLPPSLHFTAANPEIDFANTPFHVNTRLRDWAADGPRRAVVMSTGMGGTNACVVLEESPRDAKGDHQVAQSEEEPTPQLLVLSARSETALERATKRLREFLNHDRSVSLREVAGTLQLGRKALSHRRYMVGTDAVSMLPDDRAAPMVTGRAGDTARPLIFLLPGVGDHHVGMGHDLYRAWPVFKDEVDRCARMLEEHLGVDIRELLYPATGSWKQRARSTGTDLKRMLGQRTGRPEDPDAARLHQTQFAQPALFTIEYAVCRLWQSLGIQPAALVGHSLGEYVAACLAGVFPLEDALRLVAIRARLASELPPGAMLAVTLAEDELNPLLPAELSISLINGARLCVVAGPTDAVTDFEKSMTQRGVICRRVANAHAFHSRLLEPMVPAFEAEVRKVTLNEPVIPYISNVTGRWITTAEATSPACWARHASHPARFNDALEQLWQFRHPVLLEAGPGRTLGVLAGQHPGRRDSGDALIVSSLHHEYEGGSEVAHFLESVGKVWLTGATIDWRNLQGGTRPRRIPLPTYPFERQLCWLAAPARGEVANVDQRGNASSIHKSPDASRWLYAPSWKRLSPPAVAGWNSSSIPPGHWLVFADSHGFADALIDRLEAAGHHVTSVGTGAAFEQNTADRFTLDPADARQYDRLVRTLSDSRPPPDRIVHAWSLAPWSDRGADEASFDRAQVPGFYSLLHLARALAAGHVTREVRWYVVSNHLHDVHGTERVDAGKSTLLGPCLVIGQEFPNVRMRCVEVDGWNQNEPTETAAIVEQFMAELGAGDPGPLVAHRGGHRWARSYEPFTPAMATPEAGAFRERGVYLITGGLGGIGRTVSEHLAKRYQARLVLVNRTALHGHNERERFVRQLEELGAQVWCASADVADRTAMRAVVEGTMERFGALHGVIHGAGVVGNAGYREIQDADPAGCERHFRAKARGLLVLDQVLRDRDLDFCLLMSSLSSVLGGIGQAAYTAANLFLDSFVSATKRNSRVPWLSVNWDVWRLDRRVGTDTVPGGTLKELGMTTGESLAMLERVVALKAAGQLVVSTGDLDSRINQWLNPGSRTVGAGTSTVEAGRMPALRTGRPVTNGDLPRDEIERQVAGVWREALGLDAVEIHENFSALGGHSLLAIRIVNELRNRFQIELPIRALFDAPTIAELAGRVRDRLVADIDALSDEEAGELVTCP